MVISDGNFMATQLVSKERPKAKKLFSPYLLSFIFTRVFDPFFVTQFHVK
jgi:hypothetical protein